MAYIRPSKQQFKEYSLKAIEKVSNDLGGITAQFDTEYSFQEPGFYALYIDIDKEAGGKVELVYKGKVVYRKQPKYYSGLERTINHAHAVLRDRLHREGVLKEFWGNQSVVDAIYEASLVG